MGNSSHVLGQSSHSLNRGPAVSLFRWTLWPVNPSEVDWLCQDAGALLGFLHSWIYSVITHICMVSWVHINNASDSNSCFRDHCISDVVSVFLSLTSNTVYKTINFCYREQRNKSFGHVYWHRLGIPIQVKARIFLLEKMSSGGHFKPNNDILVNVSWLAGPPYHMSPTDIASTSALVSCLGSCSMQYKKKGGEITFCNIILKNTQVFKALEPNKTGCVSIYSWMRSSSHQQMSTSISSIRRCTLAPATCLHLEHIIKKKEKMFIRSSLRLRAI